MTNKQRIELQISEQRTKINDILKQETRSQEDLNQLTELTTRSQNLEIEYRAAVVSEGQEEQRKLGETQDGDGESAELRSLFSRVSLNDYLAPASAGTGVDGAARELNAALGVSVMGHSGGVAVPFQMLMERRADNPELETRAYTDTSNNDGQETQRPILQRLFGPGVMDYLGVRIDSVPVGRAEWPLLSSGTTSAQTKEGTAAAAAAAATFTYANMKPKRLTGSYEYTVEMAASVSDLEAALRRDLADVIKSKMTDTIINGTAPTNSNPQHIQGFLTKVTSTDFGALATASTFGELHANGVDGIHAEMESQVKSVIGITTYQRAAGVYLAGSGEAGSDLLKRRSGGCYASSYIPDVATHKQSAILHSAGPNGGGAMRGDSVAAMWPSMEVIRDHYTKAGEGGVVLTWITLWDAVVAFRTGAYKVFKLTVTS